MVYALIASTWKAEAGGSKFKVIFRFEARLDCLDYVGPCFKTGVCVHAEDDTAALFLSEGCLFLEICWRV